VRAIFSQGIFADFSQRCDSGALLLKGEYGAEASLLSNPIGLRQNGRLPVKPQSTSRERKDVRAFVVACSAIARRHITGRAHHCARSGQAANQGLKTTAASQAK